MTKKGGLIRAKVFVTVEEPYTEQDYSDMDSFEAERSKAFGLKKIIGEKKIAEIVAKDQDQFRHKVLSLCERNKPSPLFVKILGNNTLGRTFIAKSRHREASSNPTVECVDFAYGRKGRAIIKFIESRQKKYGKEMERFLAEKTGTDDPWMLPYNEKHRKEISHAIEEFGKPLEEKMYSDVAKRFEIDRKRLVPSAQNNGRLPYRTVAEAQIEREIYGNTASLQSMLFDYIKEKRRFIGKGCMSTFFILRYREQVHPELLTAEEAAGGVVSFGSQLMDGHAIMHSENSLFHLCHRLRRTRRRIK